MSDDSKLQLSCSIHKKNIFQQKKVNSWRYNFLFRFEVCSFAILFFFSSCSQCILFVFRNVFPVLLIMSVHDRDCCGSASCVLNYISAFLLNDQYKKLKIITKLAMTETPYTTWNKTGVMYY